MKSLLLNFSKFGPFKNPNFYEFQLLKQSFVQEKKYVSSLALTFLLTKNKERRKEKKSKKKRKDKKKRKNNKNKKKRKREKTKRRVRREEKGDNEEKEEKEEK